MSLFSPLSYSFLGFDPFFNEVDKLLHAAKVGNIANSDPYPPLNIYKNEDGGYNIELALAGYKKDDITIEHDKKNGILTISGDSRPRLQAKAVAIEMQNANANTNLAVSTQIPVSKQVIRRGIADRKFVRNFTMADDLVIESVVLEDGMLSIQVKKQDLPENRPIRIEIS